MNDSINVCSIASVEPSARFARPARRRDAALIAALTDAAMRYPRWRFWKLFDRLRVEGRRWNHKHVHRVWHAAAEFAAPDDAAGASTDSSATHGAAGVNQTWALDFMTETLYDGRRVRLLTMIDEGNREGREIATDVSLPSRRGVRVLNELVAADPARG